MSLQEVLARLRVDYVASIPVKIQSIEGLWKAGEIDLLRTEFHKFKGTGRTYGLPEVSQLGAAMERVCDLDHAPYPMIAECLPLSVNLLASARAQRVSGLTPVFEGEADFQKILSVLDMKKAQP